MRKASRIYKRKSRSNLETLIILIGAIIILGVAFYLAREKSYIPPEAQVITEEKEEEIQVIEVPIEVSQKITVEKVEEGEESLEIVIKKEAVSEEKLPITEPTMVKIPEVESGVNVLKESEIATEKKIFTVQVGAFSEEKNAQNLAKEISDKGYQTYVVKGKTLYKVQVGEFKSYEEAQNVSQKLKESGYPIDSFIRTR